MFGKCSVFRVLFLAAFVVTISANAQYQPDSFQFSNLGMRDGLSHNQVNTILKDSQGFLWVGTFSGLNRFDGQEVKVFEHDPDDPKSLNSNNIQDLFLDPQGNMWVKTLIGLQVYDPVQEQFHAEYSPYLSTYGLLAQGLENIVRDWDSCYWFILSGAGVSQYNPITKQSANIGANQLASGNVADLAKDKSGDIWLIHHNGLLEKIDGTTFQRSVLHESIHHYFEGNEMEYKMVMDRDGDLWIYLPDNRTGLFYYDVSLGEMTHFRQNHPRLPLNSDLVTSLLEDKDGNIWIGTDHGGINLLDKKDFSLRYLMHDEGLAYSLAHNSIYDLYQDDEGIIWIGTYKNGVNYYHSNNLRFYHYHHIQSRPNSLPYNDVNRFAEDEEGNLWVGTNGGGLLYLDRSKDTFTQIQKRDDKGLGSDVVVSMLFDSNSNLWVGTFYGGLVKYEGEKAIRYDKGMNAPYRLPDENVWELYEDSKGNIWMGTLTSGLFYLPKGEIEFRKPPIATGENLVNVNYVAAILEDSKGNIWIGGSAGLDLIEMGTGKVKSFVHQPGNTNSLPHDNVMYIFEDSNGAIWLGTQSGLALYEPSKNLFQNFSTKDGLPHNTVLTILESEGELWLSTLKGITKTQVPTNPDFRNYTFKNYDKEPDLKDLAFNENACLQTGRGELIFGGPHGFNIFDPRSLHWSYDPKVIFSSFELFNQPVEIGKAYNGRVILDMALTGSPSITLKHDENVFSVSFVSLNFFQHLKNGYMYKMEGFDTEWQKTDHQNRRLTYTNLNPGTYTLKVSVINEDGGLGMYVAELPITILAPFWKTGWAYFCYSVLFVMILVYARYLVIQRAKGKFLLEQERREARQLHELDMMKIHFLTNISHEFRTPLSLILAPMDKLMKKEQDIDRKKQYQMIERNARRLLHLVNQLLDFRKIETESVSFHPAEGDIIAFVQEAVYSFSQLSEKQHVKLIFESEIDSLYITFDMDKMEKILFNLLSNAFKFTPEHGVIQVNVKSVAEQGQKQLCISVKDSGIGIANDQLDKIFERFYRSPTPAGVVNQGSGIGLSIVNEFVKLHAGHIEVQSTLGHGSCFKIILPYSPLCREDTGKVIGGNTMLESEIQREPKANIGHAQAKNIKLLLVEDNEDFRQYLKESLGEYFEVEDAENGKSGWKKVLFGKPDIIVSDLMMPEINGIALCQKVKNDPRTAHIPFILLTAFTGQDKKLQGLDIGANDYITKPFSFELLLVRIQNLIKQNQLLQKTFEKKVSVDTQEVEITSMDDKLILKASRIIEDNLSDPEFSVESLSRELGMSRVHLYNKLTTITGMSPLEFIRHHRLERSLQYLEKSQLSVSEVAYQVGFNSAKVFSKYFKAVYQVSPSNYQSSKKQIARE
ncbi:two-component regulator propeller domain-containing protein [Belliella marina]|uniref:histidine kinase n=1 Tax=Belliella marina TaxID=1644146 RepID=A0ABW4VHI2_9BACT